MNTAVASPAKSVEFYYPISCKEFTEEQLLQHMRVPGSIWQAPSPHSALVGISHSTGTYQTVFLGAPGTKDEDWTEVTPKRRGHGAQWKGSKATAMAH